MANPLDRPVWHALHGRQSCLAQSGLGLRQGEAVRIDPAYGPFAAAAVGHEGDLAAFLTHDNDEVWLVETTVVAPPPGTRLIRSAPLLQMIADGPLPPAPVDPAIVALGEGDVPEMTALALATQPGPWGPSTWRYGQFYGIRIDGRLAAMAGERMRPAPGLAEVSGVCTWPEHRGQGMAARLIRRVMAGHRARGDMSFLHSYAGNVAAIKLYEQLGFRPRAAMVATILGKA
ncbi:GNAT family N-acetyltransferase [Novosphingobium sp.]|uniref:GNAT family N-acetyltransferase n=1 Tax=Novosphingobium sp. TaxID=1874826 RepID=UPI0038B804AD